MLSPIASSTDSSRSFFGRFQRSEVLQNKAQYMIPALAWMCHYQAPTWCTITSTSLLSCTKQRILATESHTTQSTLSNGHVWYCVSTWIQVNLSPARRWSHRVQSSALWPSASPLKINLELGSTSFELELIKFRYLIPSRWVSGSQDVSTWM